MDYHQAKAKSIIREGLMEFSQWLADEEPQIKTTNNPYASVEATYYKLNEATDKIYNQLVEKTSGIL